ncbi:MAG: hypothetical protein AAF387_21535 [Pseudomonadota bacterium]
MQLTTSKFISFYFCVVLSAVPLLSHGHPQHDFHTHGFFDPGSLTVVGSVAAIILVMFMAKTRIKKILEQSNDRHRGV